MSLRRELGWVAREDREPVSLSGFATLADGRTIAVDLTDLSRDGCRLRSEEVLRIGEQVRVNIGSTDPMSGTVRWSLFGTAGVRFEAPRAA